MSKAQIEFRNRDGEDNRIFTTWYHNEDVQRLIWHIYQHVPADKKQYFLKPFVFYDSMEKDENTRLDKLLSACHLLLCEHNLKFLPFIVKPQGLPHFYAGFVHSNPDYIYIFDPVGINTRRNISKFQKFFHVSSSNYMNNKLLVVGSAESIQKPDYEPSLVSCGPLCVAFLDYIMHYPEVIGTTGVPKSIVPPDLAKLVSASKENYEKVLVAIRVQHDEYLGSLTDNQLASAEFDAFYQELSTILLNLGDEDIAEALTEIPAPYTNKEVEQILGEIYRSLPIEAHKFTMIPQIVTNETYDIENQVSLILQTKNLPLAPFLFKLKDSQQFCAGLINTTCIFLYIPNGLIPEHINLKDHLGLSGKSAIKGLPVIILSQKKLHAPHYKSIATLLSIHFLTYVMQHGHIFSAPSEFIDLLNMHAPHYQSYIETLHQNQKRYLLKSVTPKQGMLASRQKSRPILNQTAQETYLQYFRELRDVIRKAEEMSTPIHGALSPPDEARTFALKQARAILKELLALLPVQENGCDFRGTHLPLDDQQFLRLADLCSHVAQGLSFITDHQTIQQRNLFRYTRGSTGNLLCLEYDVDMHRLCMQHVSKMASLLPGAGWQNLKKALYLIAMALLVACGTMLLAGTPISMGLLMTLGSAATLSAGIGFFVGCNTGIAKSAHAASMPDMERLHPVRLSRRH